MNALPKQNPPAATLLSLNNYHYQRGGADIAFLRHNALLESAGWRVVPLSMQHPNNEPTEWAEHFVEEIELGQPYSPFERVRKGLKAAYSFESRRKVEQLIDLVAPDICHAHNIYHHISPSVLGAIKKKGVPLVMTLHDLKIACPNYSMLSHDGVCERCRGGRLYNVALHRCIKNNLPMSMLVMLESYVHRLLGSYTRNVDCFLVPSLFYIEKLAEWGFDTSRFVHVPNFIDGERFVPQYEPGKRFLYFGRLSPEKGGKTLIRAAHAAGVGLDIAGTGPEREALERLAAELGSDVRFLGFLTGEPLHSAVRYARAVVIPSEWYENAPLSVLEAAAMGKPVIAADIGGLPEMVLDGETGWVFTSGSVPDLARVLSDARERDAEIEERGRRARDRVLRRFSSEAYLTNIADVYRRLGVEPLSSGGAVG